MIKAVNEWTECVTMVLERHSPLPHERDVDTVGGGHGGEGNEPAHDGGETLVGGGDRIYTGVINNTTQLKPIERSDLK